MSGMIYYIFGKSASGKDTIYKRLIAETGWRRVVPYTTRPIRDGEKEGVEYHFISRGALKKLREDGRVIEERVYHTVYGDWYYATVDDGQIKPSGEDDYLMIGVLSSFLSIRAYYGKDYVFPIYIEVPDAIRLERATKREMQEKIPKLEEMKRRFLADNQDFSEENLRKAGIGKHYQNIDLEGCIYEILEDTGKSHL